MSRALTKGKSRVLSLGFIAWTACSSHPITITIEREQIQQRVEAKFPVQQELLFSKITLEHPQVILRDGSDRIGVELKFRAEAPLLPAYGGDIAATGDLSYRREEKAFYLRNPTIERLEIDGVRPEHAALVRKPAEAAAGAALDAIPVYRLDGKDLKEAGARHLLRDVAIKNGKVYATLAVGSAR